MTFPIIYVAVILVFMLVALMRECLRPGLILFSAVVLLLIAGIIRDEELITPTGQDVIKEGDSVIIVTLEEGFDNLNDILNF